MHTRPHGAPALRAPTFSDLSESLRQGLRDFAAAPIHGLFYGAFYVAAGLAMAAITWATGQTFWLVLAVLGFPLIGAFAALGLYETSHRLEDGQNPSLGAVQRVVWAHRGGQLPWIAAIIVVILLFWFFLGHMIFALFLGLSPMTNVSSSLDVFFTPNGLSMLAFGTVIGAAISALVFAICVNGLPMILDRDVDFMTAMIASVGAVLRAPLVYLIWGGFIGAVTLTAMVPAFLGLFVALPVLGHATWHLYRRVSAAG